MKKYKVDLFWNYYNTETEECFNEGDTFTVGAENERDAIGEAYIQFYKAIQKYPIHEEFTLHPSWTRIVS